MKVIVSSAGEDSNSEVDARFGRCPYFVLFEIEDKKIVNERVIKNVAMSQQGGAGISAAELVGNEKVDAIITVNIGPRAFQVLQQLDIEIYKGAGKIKEVIEQFIEGKLEKISLPTGPNFLNKE